MGDFKSRTETVSISRDLNKRSFISAALNQTGRHTLLYFHTKTGSSLFLTILWLRERDKDSFSSGKCTWSDQINWSTDSPTSKVSEFTLWTVRSRTPQRTNSK